MLIRLSDSMTRWWHLTPDHTPPVSDLSTSGHTRGPDRWMIQPKPQPHLSHWLQNVTSVFGFCSLVSLVSSYLAVRREKQETHREQNYSLGTLRIVYGLDSEKTVCRVCRLLCWGFDKSLGQFSHNQCQISQMLSHPFPAHISHHWPEAWTRTVGGKNTFPLQ